MLGEGTPTGMSIDAVDLSALTIACALQVGGKTIELVVQRDDAAWRWEMRFADDEILDRGTATTRLAAQLTAQNAFERRLKRAGLLRDFDGYRWNDVSARSQSFSVR